MGIESQVVGGLIGIVGTAVGLVIGRFLRGFGRIQLHGSDWRIVYQGQDAGAGLIQVPPDAAKFGKFHFQIDVYNSREEPAGLRQPRVEFVADGKPLITFAPQDADRSRLTTERLVYDKIEVINLAPKQWSHWNIVQAFAGDELSKIRQSDEVYFAATDARGKRRLWLIASLKPQQDQ